MIKKLLIILLVCLLIFAAVFIGLGFVPRTDVFLVDYTVSQDGSQIELQVAVASSMGYTRAFRSKQGGFNEYVTFYSAFGGFNSKIGARSSFVLDVDAINCDEIYFYHGNGGYQLVLQKNPETNVWERVTQ